MRPEDVPQCARASKGGCVYAPSYDVPIPLPRCLPSAHLTATSHILSTKYSRALLVRVCDERAEAPQRYSRRCSPRMNPVGVEPHQPERMRDGSCSATNATHAPLARAPRSLFGCGSANAATAVGAACAERGGPCEHTIGARGEALALFTKTSKSSPAGRAHEDLAHSPHRRTALAVAAAACSAACASTGYGTCRSVQSRGRSPT